MSCGIICKLDPDSPFMELARIRAFVDSLPGEVAEPEPDWDDQFIRWLMIFMGVASVIAGVIILGALAYGIVTTIAAAVS